MNGLPPSGRVVRGADDLVVGPHPGVGRIVESGNAAALAAGDRGVGVASQLLEIGAFLIPDDEIAAPVERLDVARRDVGYQPKPLGPDPAGELHQVAHVHVLVAVVEVELPARHGIGHHHVDVAVHAGRRLARARRADRPLRGRRSRECRRKRDAHAEQLENPAHAALPGVSNLQRRWCRRADALF